LAPNGGKKKKREGERPFSKYIRHLGRKKKRTKGGGKKRKAWVLPFAYLTGKKEETKGEGGREGKRGGGKKSDLCWLRSGLLGMTGGEEKEGRRGEE